MGSLVQGRIRTRGAAKGWNTLDLRGQVVGPIHSITGTGLARPLMHALVLPQLRRVRKRLHALESA